MHFAGFLPMSFASSSLANVEDFQNEAEHRQLSQVAKGELELAKTRVRCLTYSGSHHPPWLHYEQDPDDKSRGIKHRHARWRAPCR